MDPSLKPPAIRYKKKNVCVYLLPTLLANCIVQCKSNVHYIHLTFLLLYSSQFVPSSPKECTPSSACMTGKP